MTSVNLRQQKLEQQVRYFSLDMNFISRKWTGTSCDDTIMYFVRFCSVKYRLRICCRGKLWSKRCARNDKLRAWSKLLMLDLFQQKVRMDFSPEPLLQPTEVENFMVCQNWIPFLFFFINSDICSQLRHQLSYQQSSLWQVMMDHCSTPWRQEIQIP